ncbi:hypothetical protein PIB30_033963 [Stylosanthes scabra]|uniref:CCHC-type domain-containing protein n=1 Tax=Stylosanthes scabra TaxID=79078 RepID=A0ABU6RD58_9FABA|nr:hypothetical protein [Stylosanthes scabra]
MPPPFRKAAHRPTKKRRRGPGEEEGTRSHLSRMGQIQRCSNCGAAGHKKRGCPKPPQSAQCSKKANTGTKNGGKGKAFNKETPKSLSQPLPETSAKKRKADFGTSSSQPQTQAKSNASPKSSQPKTAP